jgi:hypothetical protein
MVESWLTAVALLGAAQDTTPVPVPVADAGARVIRAHRLGPADRIRLDGVLDEPFWREAEVAGDFRQQDPREGEPATERTEVRVAYDAHNLLLGVMLYDSDPAGVLGRQLERDAGLGADDRFMWVLDTFLDGRNAYFFEINPAGLMGDGLLRAGSVNKSWDGIWEARVVRHDRGWSAEIRIPFRTLNFDPARDTWGINFQRTVRRKAEESLWAGHLRQQGLMRVAHAGRVTGLEGMSQGIGLEARPYVVGSVQAAPARGASGTETPGDLGVDLTYSITPSLRASLTLNTDFAEAEVDQRRVNLTRFPISFPERRDFFLEGSGVYAFAQSSGPTPFFSRRIGLIEGEPVPIVWGARLAGQVGAQDVGFQHVRTQSMAGVPAERFSVARVKRSVLRQSTLGAIWTWRQAEPLDSMEARAAHTVGMDLDLFTSRFRGDRNLQFEAFVVWHEEFAGHEGTTFGDRSARGIRLNYPNDPLRAHVSLREFGRAYDPPVGFVPRRGFRRLQPTVTYVPRPAWAAVRQLELGTFVEYLTDLSGRLETFNLSVTLPGVRFESGDQVELSAGTTTEQIDREFRIRPELVIPPGRYATRRIELSASTASRRTVAAEAAVWRGGFWSGTRTRLQAGLQARPRAGLSASGSWEWNGVELPNGGFRTNLLRTGGAWQLSPWVSLNGSVQYDDVTRVLGLYGRFRWTLRPGSDLFVVYTHNLRDAGLGLDPRSGLETLDRRASTKFTYTHRF